MSTYVRNPDVPAARIGVYPKRRRLQRREKIFRPPVSVGPSYADFFTEVAASSAVA